MNAIDLRRGTIVLRPNPDNLPGPHLLPYTRPSKSDKLSYTINGITLPSLFVDLSVQNLRRIHQQYGKVAILGETDLLQNLRDEQAVMRRSIDAALGAKESKDKGMEYKLPPLGPFQHTGVLYLVSVPRAALFADCGMGKTFMVLVSTEWQIKAGLIPRGKTLICGKLATLETGWMEDAEKFTDLKVNMLWTSSTYKKREKILQKLEEDADVYLINHDGLRAYEKELIRKNFAKVVIDESTILKGFSGMDPRIKGGVFGKALMRVSASANWRVIMSGTPAPNGAQDLWGQFHFLDPRGINLEASWHDFKKTYMSLHFFGALKKDSKGNAIPGVPANPDCPSKWTMRAASIPKIAEIINPLAYRLKIRDHIKDLPEKTRLKRVAKMTKEQIKHYEEMEETLSTIIDNEMVSVANRMVELMKLRQITGGFLIDHQDKTHPLKKNPKLDIMDSLLHDEIDVHEKVVIFAQYRWEVETLESRYKKYGTVSVYGGNTSGVNMQAIKDFREKPEVRIIILHPRSAAHGITLTMANYMIFYSISHSEEERYQAEARIERAGQKNAMFIYYLLCENTIDEKMYKVLIKKASDQSELIDHNRIAMDLLNDWRRKKKAA